MPGFASQVTLCDPIWHVSSRSGAVLVAQTAIRASFFFLPCVAHVPGVHGEGRHVHLVLGLERVISCGDVVQRQRAERTAERKERQGSRVALETLTLKQTNLSADLQRLHSIDSQHTFAHRA